MAAPARMAALLKDAALAAFVAFALAFPMVGFQTVDVSGGFGITVVTRFGDVAISVALVFIGRLALSLLDDRAKRLPILLVAGVLALGLPFVSTGSPVISWLTVIAAGEWFGLLGMFLAVPALAIGRVLFDFLRLRVRITP